ncbi:hypothetical protein PQX77_004505 [Marasmius sp. AFHP31]|nr:hypothetical protein PQX77_004505 [Marasmius sp. AFHP31]
MSTERELRAQKLRRELLEYSAAFAQMHTEQKNTTTSQRSSPSRISGQIAILFRAQQKESPSSSTGGLNAPENLEDNTSTAADIWTRPLPPHLTSWIIPSRSRDIQPAPVPLTTRLPKQKKKEVAPKFSWTIHSQHGRLQRPTPVPKPARSISNRSMDVDSASILTMTTSDTMSLSSSPVWWRRRFETPTDIEMREMEWQRTMEMAECLEEMKEEEMEEEEEERRY